MLFLSCPFLWFCFLHVLILHHHQQLQLFFRSIPGLDSIILCHFWLHVPSTTQNLYDSKNLVNQSYTQINYPSTGSHFSCNQHKQLHKFRLRTNLAKQRGLAKDSICLRNRKFSISVLRFSSSEALKRKSREVYTLRKVDHPSFYSQSESIKSSCWHYYSFFVLGFLFVLFGGCHTGNLKIEFPGVSSCCAPNQWPRKIWHFGSSKRDVPHPQGPSPTPWQHRDSGAFPVTGEEGICGSQRPLGGFAAPLPSPCPATLGTSCLI